LDCTSGKQIFDSREVKEIAEYIGLKDYPIPKYIIDVRKQIYYILQNYFLKAKEMYREIEVKDVYQEYIRQFYEQAIRSGMDISNDGIDITQRSKNTCYRVLKALACLRLDNGVNDWDFDYFKLRAVNLITVFRNSKYFSKEFIDLDLIYMKTLTDLFKLRDNPIDIAEHIVFMREYILRNSFNYSLKEEEIPEDSEGLKRLDKLLPKSTAQRCNYRYVQLIKNNKEKLLEEYGINTMKIKRKTHYVKKVNWMPEDVDKNDLVVRLKNRINEILNADGGSQVEFKDLMRVITIDITEINEKQITFWIKSLIELGEIDGNKILHFHY